jgi:hypothetical protein
MRCTCPDRIRSYPALRRLSVRSSYAINVSRQIRFPSSNVAIGVRPQHIPLMCAFMVVRVDPWPGLTNSRGSSFNRTQGARVELLVRDHLATEHSPVFYVENGLICSLFGLLCWHAHLCTYPRRVLSPVPRTCRFMEQ